MHMDVFSTADMSSSVSALRTEWLQPLGNGLRSSRKTMKASTSAGAIGVAYDMNLGGM